MKLQHGANQVHKRARSIFFFSFSIRAREWGFLPKQAGGIIGELSSLYTPKVLRSSYRGNGKLRSVFQAD